MVCFVLQLFSIVVCGCRLFSGLDLALVFPVPLLHQDGPPLDDTRCAEHKPDHTQFRLLVGFFNHRIEELQSCAAAQLGISSTQWLREQFNQVNGDGTLRALGQPKSGRNRRPVSWLCAGGGYPEANMVRWGFQPLFV